MTRWWLPVVAVLGAGFIAVVALQGERPVGGMIEYRARGFLAAQAAADLGEIEVEANGRRRSFKRGTGAWQEIPAELGRALDLGVKLLRETAPERNLAGDELAGARLGGISLADYGLNPPALSVTMRGPKLASFRIEFGGTNPLGQSRYVRIDGREIWLVPRHVAEAWEVVARAP